MHDATLPAHEPHNVVIDTNVVLDMLVFKNPTQWELLTAIDKGQVRWLVTQVMLNELTFVLQRPGLLPWLEKAGISAAQCLGVVETKTQHVRVSPPCGFRCKDPSDQGFVDLAVQAKASLVSRDKAVLRLASRLARVGVGVAPNFTRAMALTNLYPGAIPAAALVI